MALRSEVDKLPETISSEQFHEIINTQGNSFTKEELQGILSELLSESQGLLSCRALSRCLQHRSIPQGQASEQSPPGYPASAQKTQEARGNTVAAATASKEYDLADKNGLADFLEHADIQLGGSGKRRISKDALHVIVRNLKGDRFTVDMLQDILQEVVPDREGLLSCEDLASCLRRPDPAPEPQKPKRYDLAQKQGLADFLRDADIRLVRADFLLKLQREGQRLPRRQEAESAYVQSHTALVTHEEVQAWADGKAPDGTQVVSLSHCWESREHCDPYGYQVSKLAKALTGKEWLFIDYVSLYQFQRLSRKQNVSFRRAMQHMHVLYCHDKTSTLRIESLTPEADIIEAERKQDRVVMYDHPTGLVKPVPVTELVKNRTPYKQRGWCAAEREWSSTRTATNLSREVDSPEGEKGGSAPMVPEAFRENVAHQLKFTHLDDVETVCRLQAEVYKEKAEMCRSLRLVDLGADALDIALSALERYPNLESLEIVRCELGQKLPLLLQVLEEIKLRQLHLQQNELFEEGTRRVIEALALQSNGTLAALSLGHDLIGVANVKALAEALRTNSALIKLNLSHVGLDREGFSALTEAVKQNQTLKQLSLAGNLEIAEESAFALLEALRMSGVKVALEDCDLGQTAVAMARALRTIQVKGEVAHPVVEVLLQLQDRQFKELEEQRRLELNLNYGDGGERFRRLFEPLCRALRAPQLPQLRELELRLYDLGAAFGDDRARSLALGLQQQKELQGLELRLYRNSLGPEGAQAVACALGELTELKALVLNLHQTKIRDAGAASVAASLRKLRQLTKLSVGLEKTGLSPAGATAVLEAVRWLPHLTKLGLDLSKNELSQQEKEKLRATLDALPVAEKRIFL